MWPEFIEVGFILVGACIGIALPSRSRRELTPVLMTIGFAALVEGLAIVLPMMETDMSVDNTWMYNIYLPVDVWATAWLGAGCLGARRPALLAFGVGTLYGALMIFELRSKDSSGVFANRVFLFFSLASCLALVIGLFRIVQQDGSPLFTQWAFWALFGQLVYYGAMTPYNGLVDHLMETNMPLARSLSIINPLLASLRYAFLAVAGGVALVYPRMPRHRNAV